MSKHLFLSGSTRKGSFNIKLARYAFKLAQQKGADAEYVDLTDYEMPLYNGDLEAEKGIPENAKRLKEKFRACEGFFIASPEYNSSFSPLVKNTIDWMSRPHEEKEPMLVAFQGKFAALSAASPGGLGGLRGLVPLRMCLGNIGVLVLPQQVAVSKAFEAFDESGNLTDERFHKSLDHVVTSFVNFQGQKVG